MNWTKIGVNVAAAIIGALVAQSVIPSQYAAAATAVAGVLVGLFQQPPHQS